MSTEQNKALIRQQYQEIDRKGFANAVELLAPNFVAHLPGAPGPMNLEAFRQYAAAFDAGFPGYRHAIEDQIAEGDKVVTRITWHGTHTGNFQGLPPTGKQVTMTAMNIHRIANGKIVEHRAEFDALGMMQQLGVIPAMG